MFNILFTCALMKTGAEAQPSPTTTKAAQQVSNAQKHNQANTPNRTQRASANAPNRTQRASANAPNRTQRASTNAQKHKQTNTPDVHGHAQQAKPQSQKEKIEYALQFPADNAAGVAKVHPKFWKKYKSHLGDQELWPNQGIEDDADYTAYKDGSGYSMPLGANLSNSGGRHEENLAILTKIIGPDRVEAIMKDPTNKNNTMKGREVKQFAREVAKKHFAKAFKGLKLNEVIKDPSFMGLGSVTYNRPALSTKMHDYDMRYRHPRMLAGLDMLASHVPTGKYSSVWDRRFEDTKQSLTANAAAMGYEDTVSNALDAYLKENPGSREQAQKKAEAVKNVIRNLNQSYAESSLNSLEKAFTSPDKSWEDQYNETKDKLNNLIAGRKMSDNIMKLVDHHLKEEPKTLEEAREKIDMGKTVIRNILENHK